MRPFDRDEIYAIKYFSWFIFIIGIMLGLILYCTAGCSSVSIAKQAKVGNAISVQLDELHVAIVEACNSGRLSETTCDTVVRTYNNVLQVHKEYMYSLQALSQGRTTQEQTTLMLSRVQTHINNLVTMLTNYGVLKGEKK